MASKAAKHRGPSSSSLDRAGRSQHRLPSISPSPRGSPRPRPEETPQIVPRLPSTQQPTESQEQAKEQAKVQQQGPEAAEQVTDPEQAASQQILKFLVGIKQLRGVSDGRDLEAALFARRFDLLFAMGDDSGRYMPQFQSLPKKQMLKEFLMSGKLHGGYQSVAHVLYPDAVRWPDQVIDGGLEGDELARQDIGTSGSERPTSRSSAGSKRSKTRGAAPESSVAPKRVFSDDEFPDVDEELEESVQGKDEKVVEIVLCGKPVQSTVRGKALREVLPLHEASAASKKEVTPRAMPEARFRAAQQARRKLERAVQLEEYQERRLAERIQALEIALEDETAHQKELEKRQKKREVRQEQLKKDLEEGWARKFEAERWQAEEEKRKEEEKQKEKERFERYRQAQKERLEKWQEERSSYDFFMDPVERARFRRMELEREADLAALEKREAKEERCPIRRLEVEARLQELEDSLDQRPFMPPRPPERPKPVLEQLDEASGKVPPASAKPAAPKAGAWIGEARGLSKRYGLSAEHLRTIESHLQRSIKVPGPRQSSSREPQRTPRVPSIPETTEAPAA